MYKLRDVPENIEFYGPPHPEDPLGELTFFKNKKKTLIFISKVQLYGHVHILIVVVQIN